ncbi:MAG: outer membrane lipoprotein chaperone LolA [Deltaproteobacteria bacterium]|nr:outer membrane lipoprotein chaperone LolA [Deltaproteobacteria bacterium]
MRGLKKLAGGVLSCLFLLVPLLTCAADIDDIITRLQKNYEEVSSISSDFTQETYYKSLGQRVKAEGRVYLKKPGRMRWSYSGPEAEEIISNGTTIWVYQPDLAQVIEAPAAGGPPAMAMKFLMGTVDLKKDFSAKLIEETRDAYVISLAPTPPRPNIKKIIVEVDKSRFLVVKTVVMDSFGAEATVTLEDINLNPKLDDKIFEFKAPAGAKTVRP